ncbi:unnamed protein product, partial [marine sediment metagenome]
MMKMKTRFNILFLLSLLLIVFFLGSIEAVSGCCSHHDGVCCECGAQSDGKVICNDGWTESSCYYNKMAMCQTISIINTSCSFSSPSHVNSPCKTDSDCACSTSHCGCVLKDYKDNPGCLCLPQA